jgi:hypothetical protein
MQGIAALRGAMDRLQRPLPGCLEERTGSALALLARSNLPGRHAPARQPKELS